MSARFLRFSTAVLGLPIALLSIAVAPAGCDITTIECGEGATCQKAQEPESLCPSYCEHLVDCGDVAPASESECRSTCRAASVADPDTTETACRCRIEASCGDAHQCPALRSPGTGSSVSSSSSSSATSSSGQGAGGGGGTTCTASCQCPEGLICVDGQCGPAEPTPMTCEDDCDCPSGEACVAGSCE